MGQYDTPQWFKSGCLPRESVFGKLKGCPPLRDVIDIIPKSEWQGLLEQHDGQRQFIPNDGIYDQGQVGSCAAESSNQAISVVTVFTGQPHILFNPYFTYHTTSGGSDNGSTIDGNLAFLKQYGACPESAWPRSKGWQTKPSNAAYEAAYNHRILEFFDLQSVEEAGTALLLGFPVVYGSDGHAKCYVRMLSPTAGEYANSWGEGWGDEGFGTEQFNNVWWQYGAFAVRSVVDLAPVPTNPLPGVQHERLSNRRRSSQGGRNRTGRLSRQVR